jgi:hypothetical protein
MPLVSQSGPLKDSWRMPGDVMCAILRSGVEMRAADPCALVSSRTGEHRAFNSGSNTIPTHAT